MLWQLSYGAIVSLVNFGIHAVATGLIIEATRQTVRFTSAYHAFVRVASLLFVTMTALITVVNASAGWRSIILGCLILGMLPLSGRDQNR